MSVDVSKESTSSFFILAPSGTTPDVGADIVKVEDTTVQSSNSSFDIFSLNQNSFFNRGTNSITQLQIDKTKGVHLIVVPK